MRSIALHQTHTPLKNLYTIVLKLHQTYTSLENLYTKSLQLCQIHMSPKNLCTRPLKLHQKHIPLENLHIQPLDKYTTKEREEEVILAMKKKVRVLVSEERECRKERRATRCKDWVCKKRKTRLKNITKGT